MPPRPPSTERRRAAYRYGRRAERLVRLHLLLRGFRIVGSNVRAGGAELDVVARRGRTLLLCEVRARGPRSWGDPLESVGPGKLRRIRRAASALLAGRPELVGLEVVVEVVAVRGWRVERVRL